jgi:hypothetical protein
MGRDHPGTIYRRSDIRAVKWPGDPPHSIGVWAPVLETHLELVCRIFKWEADVGNTSWLIIGDFRGRLVACSERALRGSESNYQSIAAKRGPQIGYVKYYPRSAGGTVVSRFGGKGNKEEIMTTPYVESM